MAVGRRSGLATESHTAAGWAHQRALPPQEPLCSGLALSEHTQGPRLTGWGGQNGGPQRDPRPRPWNPRTCDLTWQKGLCGCVSAEAPEMARLFWVIRVGPMASRASS